MKRVMLIVALLGLLVVGCTEECWKSVAMTQPTFWLLSGANVSAGDSENEIEDTIEYQGMFGLQINQNELGLCSDWRTGSPKQYFGAYVLRFIDPNENTLLGKTYIGAKASLNVDDDGGMYGFVTGTIIPVSGIDMVTQFEARTYTDLLADRTGADDRYKVFIGPRFKL